MEKKKVILVNQVKRISNGLADYIDGNLDWTLGEEGFRNRFREILNKIVGEEIQPLSSEWKDRLFKLWFMTDDIGRKYVCRFLIVYKYSRTQSIIVEPWEGKMINIPRMSNCSLLRESIEGWGGKKLRKLM